MHELRKTSLEITGNFISIVTYKKCSRCRISKYCSETCQKKHWPTHKDHCNGIIPVLRECEGIKEAIARYSKFINQYSSAMPPPIVVLLITDVTADDLQLVRSVELGHNFQALSETDENGRKNGITQPKLISVLNVLGDFSKKNCAYLKLLYCVSTKTALTTMVAVAPCYCCKHDASCFGLVAEPVVVDNDNNNVGILSSNEEPRFAIPSSHMEWDENQYLTMEDSSNIRTLDNNNAASNEKNIPVPDFVHYNFVDQDKKKKPSKVAINAVAILVFAIFTKFML